MGSKITVIGAGSVGATIAYKLSMEDTVSEIVLIDINENKAKGEVMDIAQGASFRNPISIIAGDYDDAKDSDVVIITSGKPRKPGQTRLELTQANIDILKSITPNIVKAAPNATYIIVSNPVDIMTYAFIKMSGLPEKQIIGSGTTLDTARLRYILSEQYNIAQKNIHAYVFGEHGDSMFVPWSLAKISGATIDEFCNMECQRDMDVGDLDRDGIEEYIRKSGGEIIANKGATYYAVTNAVCYLVNMLQSAYDSVAIISWMFHGEYGIDDVCLSIPHIIGPKGVHGKLPIKMTDEELAKLRYSADQLKAIIKDINLDL